MPNLKREKMAENNGTKFRKLKSMRSILSKPFLTMGFFSLLFQANLMAQPISYDIDLPEFILKNSPALISQIKHQSGVGLDSLKIQLASLGCDEALLADKALLEQQDNYAFFLYLMGKINACEQQGEAQNKPEIETLLEDKTPYLLVAETNLDAPMSYFGHSLLLFLDEDDFYFSPVLSVLAPLESKQLFSQTIKGGFGSINAEINLTPLHQVISFYNHYESRSLRFIKLSKEQFENQKLIQYFAQKLLEAKTKPLSYNFFLNNCATYIYHSLDYACDCLDEDKTIISPALIEAQVYQAAPKSQVFELSSLLTQFNRKYQVLNDFEQLAVRQMVRKQGFQYQGIHQDLGDVAVLASRLGVETYKNTYPSYSGLIDTYGNQTNLLKSFPKAVPVIDEDKDKLNLSSVGLSFNQDESGLHLALVDYRKFYQRETFFNAEYLKAASIEIIEREGSYRLEDLSLIDIGRLQPINFITKKISWALKIGAERNQDDELRGVFRLGLGASVSLFEAKFYLLPSLEITDSTRVPVYSGFEANMGFASLAYENKDLIDHELSFYKRLNSAFALEYQAVKQESEETSHTASVFYYF